MDVARSTSLVSTLASEDLLTGFLIIYSNKDACGLTDTVYDNYRLSATDSGFKSEKSVCPSVQSIQNDRALN